MQQRPIPRTGELLAVIGMGTWQTFDPSPRTPEALDRLAEVVRVFVDAGGQVIDSSPMYGRAEQTAGDVIERLGVNDRVFIATKVWTTGLVPGKAQMEDSLRFFHRSHLDLEQVHNLIDWRTHLDWLTDGKAAGGVRYVGITHYQSSSFAQLERIMRSEQLDFIQLPYSVEMRDAEARLLPAARDTGTAVIVNVPLGTGRLFDRVRGQTVPTWAAGIATTWSQLFLKYVLSNPAVTCVIPATSNPEHMRDNMAAANGPLLDDGQRKALIDAVS